MVSDEEGETLPRWSDATHLVNTRSRREGGDVAVVGWSDLACVRVEAILTDTFKLSEDPQFGGCGADRS
jgi:hypothetical protein